MKNIAIIAHDRLKDKIVQFLREREDWIRQVNIISTGRTAEFVESKKVANVQHLQRGRSGGYNEISEKIKKGEIDIVIFFRDFEVDTHHEDIQNLLSTCNKYDIPLATNYATAELLIIGYLRKQMAEKAN
ncbi:MAG: methylglyoxal synthase [Bacteroidetes bacterium]|jgi:methylglyoxal synthase|nr:methylglyoxal synthase [Bacteroidota bacterium]MBT6684771.1 methylglyoxal synthase [Bacteroidota bacterium]MBT7141805.1 methylglyoxal synthase [Bacteroidota bacterium]MBT7490754.1 methylglyoxal synthase [Bacteroidota bacterium]